MKLQIAKRIQLLTAERLPISVVPGLHRLFLDYCSGAEAVRPFYASLPADPGETARPAASGALAGAGAAAGRAEPALPGSRGGSRSSAQGAGVVVTGQQVGLFGGPLFTPFKAATALARARQATAAGHPHAAIFWLATEDHDFAEIDHVSFPARRELRKLVYSPAAGQRSRRGRWAASCWTTRLPR